MKPIEINLSSNPYRNDTPLWVGIGLVVALALGFTAYNGWHFATANQRISRLGSELTGHRQKMEAMREEHDRLTGDLKAVDADLYATQVEFVNAILSQRNFSWTRLFNALEDVVPWDVRVTAIRPVFGDRAVEIQLSGVARNYDALLEFEGDIESYPQFEDLTPGDFNRGEAGDQVYFNIAFSYRADAVEELAPAAETPRATEAQPNEVPGADAGAAPSTERNHRAQGAAGRDRVRDAAGAALPDRPIQAAMESVSGPRAGRPSAEQRTTADQASGRVRRAGAHSRTDSGETETLPAEGAFGTRPAGDAAYDPRAAFPDDTRADIAGRANPRAAQNDVITRPDQPADPNRPRRSTIDPKQYVTYDENGKPVLKPFTKENPPPATDDPPPPAPQDGEVG